MEKLLMTESVEWHFKVFVVFIHYRSQLVITKELFYLDYSLKHEKKNGVSCGGSRQTSWLQVTHANHLAKFVPLAKWSGSIIIWRHTDSNVNCHKMKTSTGKASLFVKKQNKDKQKPKTNETKFHKTDNFRNFPQLRNKVFQKSCDLGF